SRVAAITRATTRSPQLVPHRRGRRGSPSVTPAQFEHGVTQTIRSATTTRRCGSTTNDPTWGVIRRPRRVEREACAGLAAVYRLHRSRAMIGMFARCVVVAWVGGCAFDPVIHDPSDDGAGGGSGELARCHVA